MNEPARLLVASNRGPLSFHEAGGVLTASRGGGGLVSALSSLGEDPTALWVCASLSDADRLAARDSGGRLSGGGLPLRMLDIDADTMSAAYDGIANSTLWFLHHHMFYPPLSPVFDADWYEEWAAFERFNACFADALAEEAADGALVFVQDYHLPLVPALLRALRPDLKIAHFSHTPWASPPLFRTLPVPVASQLLAGMLGADLLGFLSERWAEDFRRCCLDVLGSCDVELSVHPLGVDAGVLSTRAAAPDVVEQLPALEFPGLQVIGRVDRTELSKNIVRGLLAYRELLLTHPGLVGKVVHIATAYPSRAGLPAYQAYVAEILRVAAAVNAEFGTPGWEPVVLLLEDSYPTSLAVLQRSDVLLVNPIRDGMNLVAKEGPLLSSRAVLVLSTEAGAADELGEGALLVNPYDVSSTAASLFEALTMPAAERSRRLSLLQAASAKLPPQQWFSDQRELLEKL